jgi:hypothetical protein
MTVLTPELRLEIASTVVATFVDLMRSETEPLRSDSARELIRHRDWVHAIRSADAEEILEEAVWLAFSNDVRELRMRRRPN